MVKEFQFHMYKGSSKQGNLVKFLEGKKLKIIKEVLLLA